MKYNFVLDFNIFSDYLAFTPLLVLFLVMVYYYKKNNRYLKYHHKNILASGFFPKLGMVGTMIGLIFVFLQFDPGSMLSILHGAGFAVCSTLMGLVFDLLHSNDILKHGTTNDKQDISGYLKELTNEIKAVKYSIADINDDSTLLSQIKLSRTENNDLLREIKYSFNDFAKEMTKNNTESLIEAIQEVMNNFNDKINDNLGETFERLNSSVENLVLWQDQYKNHLEMLTNQITNAINGIKDSDKALQNIVLSMETLPNSTKELKELTTHIGMLSKEHEKHLNDLENKLSAFAEMKDKALNAMPQIETNLNNLTIGLKSNISNVINDIEKSSEILTESVKDQGKNLDTMVVNVKENIIKSTDQIESSVTKTLSNIEHNIKSQEENLTTIVLDVKKSLLQSVSDTLRSLDSGFTKQQDYLTTLTNDISKKISDTTNGMDTIIANNLGKINQSLKIQQDHIDQMVANVKNSISESTKGMNKVVEDQITIIRKNSQELIKEANASIMSIMDKLDDNVGKLDAQMQHELTKAIQTLTNNVTGFQKEFIKVHGSMINTIKHSTNQTISNVRDIR